MPSVTPELPSLTKALGDFIENNEGVFWCPVDRHSASWVLANRLKF